MKKNGFDGDVYILAIESSCDETAAAVVKNGRQVLSNVISSQIALHTLYGGVVPEIASRKHIEKINQVVEAALEEAHMALEEMTAVAVRGWWALFWWAWRRQRPLPTGRANLWWESTILRAMCRRIL